MDVRGRHLRHPDDETLARLSEEAEEVRAFTLRHLRWCSRCRSVKAEYHWLSAGLSALLASAAEQAAVPVADWSTIQKRLRARRVVQAGGRCAGLALALVSTLLLLLATPPLASASAAKRSAEVAEAVAAALPTLDAETMVRPQTATPAPGFPAAPEVHFQAAPRPAPATMSPQAMVPKP